MSKAAEDSIAKLMREGEAFAREFETFVAERPRSEFRGQDVNDWLETLTRERLDEFVTLLKVALAPEIHPLAPILVVMERRTTGNEALLAEAIRLPILRSRMRDVDRKSTRLNSSHLG